jgi:hypothetical protein
VTQTTTREPVFCQIDDAPDDNLPEPIRLTPEEYAEAVAREEGYRREWAAINRALRDNSMAVTRAMSRWYSKPEGWIGNLAIHIEHEFFGVDRPSASLQDRYGREGRTIRGLTVEQHLARLRDGLIPLAERCGRVMREALGALEELGAAPSRAVERSRPVKISVAFGSADCRGRP